MEVVLVFKIDTDIPIPAPTRGRPRKSFEIELLQVGDSFLIEGKSYRAARNMVLPLAKRLAKKNGSEPMRFRMQAGDGGVRCWRIY